MHTCDRRSNKTYIKQNFPGYKFEAGFTEKDELWRGTEAETSAAQDVRTKRVLDDVFVSDRKTFLSITTHSGETSSILRVVGHRTFKLSTGAVIPVLIKAEEIEGPAASSSIASWVAEATCTVPPITSLATGGCVCPSTISPTFSATATVSATSTGSQYLPTGFNTTIVYSNSTTIQSSTSGNVSFPQTTGISISNATLNYSTISTSTSIGQCS
ncbi:phosphoglycerate mutase [Phlyctema vagabunda]|uniref:Phosphoglycerate mutase n=1 Tax=Phlyctema vagabunda TaxID=108571 RepID=A0ABR4PIZ0_9HELO